MISYPNPDRPQIGTLFSKMMAVIILLTTMALISFGPQSSTYKAFGGRAPSTVYSTR